MTTHVLLIRTFDPPVTVDRVLNAAIEKSWCFQLHRVGWHGSFLSADGGRMCCWFEGPDRESTRLAMGHDRFDPANLWGCATVEAGLVPPFPAADTTSPRIFVEHEFADPMGPELLRTAEATASRLCGAFLSMHGRRMACVYEADDVEVVAAEQRAAGLPTTRTWAVQPVTPAMLRGKLG